MIIGLTGGIHSGKSTVLGFFKNWQWKTESLDAWVHALYAEKRAFFNAAFQSRFDTALIDESGKINAPFLAGKIFENPDDRAWLSALILPLMEARLQETIRLADSAWPLMIEVPLLYESHWAHYFDAVWCVWRNRDLILETEREKGHSIEALQARMDAQFDPDDVLNRADVGLINNTTLRVLEKQAHMLHVRVTQNALSAAK